MSKTNNADHIAASLPIKIDGRGELRMSVLSFKEIKELEDQLKADILATARVKAAQMPAELVAKVWEEASRKHDLLAFFNGVFKDQIGTLEGSAAVFTAALRPCCPDITRDEVMKSLRFDSVQQMLEQLRRLLGLPPAEGESPNDQTPKAENLRGNQPKKPRNRK